MGKRNFARMNLFACVFHIVTCFPLFLFFNFLKNFRDLLRLAQPYCFGIDDMDQHQNIKPCFYISFFFILFHNWCNSRSIIYITWLFIIYHDRKAALKSRSLNLNILAFWLWFAMQIAKEHGGIMRFIQVSCLGASSTSPSRMLRAKAAAEEAILRELPEV